MAQFEIYFSAEINLMLMKVTVLTKARLTARRQWVGFLYIAFAWTPGAWCAAPAALVSAPLLHSEHQS